MSREIKFRAWDKTREKMLLHYAHVGGRGRMHVAFEHGDEDFMTMQFTGLLDKNGKEIYEGDVVQLVRRADEGGGWHRDEDAKGVVYFDANWGVKFDCRDRTQRTSSHWVHPAWPMEERNTHWSDHELYRDYHNIEIIGNIYENPELIPKV